ncbi:ABC transporter permease [Actinopolymorpha pittospori]
MRRMILAALRGHAGRYVAGGLAIMLGVAFVATALMVTNSASAAMQESVAAQYSRADLVLTAQGEPLTPAFLGKVSDIDGVGSAAGVVQGTLRATYPGAAHQSNVQMTGLPADPALRWQQVSEGRLPERVDEVAVPENLAADKHLRLGSVLTLHLTQDQGQDQNQNRDQNLRVVGTVTGGSFVDGMSVVVTDQAMRTWYTDLIYTEVLVKAASGVDPTELRGRVATDVAGAAKVQTRDERVREAVASLTGGVDVYGAFLLGFAAIAVFVATLVVANTFTILLAQRTRELALLRCIGAVRGQVFGSVIVESLLLGLVASLAGIGVGVGLATIAMELLSRSSLGLPPGGLRLTPTGVAVPLAVGVLTTVVAALVPARRATRVSPLAALRPDLAPAPRSRAGVVRAVLAAVCFLGGVAALVAAPRTGDLMPALLVGMGGGLLSFLGILFGAPILVPALVRLLGGISGRLGGVPGRLAVGNAVRNPRRTAATSAALLVGVTLISMMTVGAASVQGTLHQTLDTQYPLDLAVDGGSTALPDGLVSDVEKIDGLEGSLTVTSAGVRAGSSGEGLQTYASAVDPAAVRKVFRDPDGIDGLAPGTAIVGPSTAGQLGVHDGGSLRLRGTDGPGIDVHVRVVSNPNTPQLLLASADLARIAPKAPVTGVWAKVAEGADGTRVAVAAQELVGDNDQVSLQGAAVERELYDRVLDILLLIATALLAVAVLIALVGVGNTLSLSVIERTREQALLRALGLTRGQLRAMLASEAVLIAAAAVVAGAVLGIGYGWAGTRILLGTVAGEVNLAIPWDRLVLVAVIALTAGLAASVLPARRAVKVAPAAALGDE